MDERKERAAATAEAGTEAGAASGVGETSPGQGRAHPPAAAAGGEQERPHRLEPSEEELIEGPLSEADALRISLLRNVRYHEDREAHFGWTNRTMDFLVLLSGTTAFAAFTGNFTPALGPIAALVTTAIGAVQLVMRRQQQEFLHGNLRCRFLALLAALNGGADLAKVRSDADGLYSEEPPTFHACDAIAYNKAQEALDRRTRRRVNSWRAITRNLSRYSSAVFPEYIAPKK